LRINWQAQLPLLPAHILSLITVIWLLVRNLIFPQSAWQSDFFIHLYPAAWLASHGQFKVIYTSLNAQTLDTRTAFDIFAHSLVRSTPPELVALFSNFPLLATALSPLAAFSLFTAFLVFTLCGVAAVALCAWLVTRGQERQSFSKVTWLSLSFFPIFQSLAMGQVDICFGLLPLTCGFCACAQGRLLLGGLIWSLTFLKLQYFVIPIFAAVTLFTVKKPACLLGIFLGLAALFLITILVTPAGTLNAWLHQMQLLNEQAINKKGIAPDHLLVSLRQAFLAVLPNQFKTAGALFTSAFGAALAIAAFFGCRNLFKKESFPKAFTRTVLMGIYLTPIASPYLLFYNLSIYWLAGAIVLVPEGNAAIESRWRRLVVWTWIAINLYMTVVLLALFIAPPHGLKVPLLLAVPLLILALAAFRSL
jgi:hypothetical protein